MPDVFSQTELDAYLDEALPAERMARLEEALRDNELLQRRLSEAIGRRDAGVHSLGDIWRRHRLSCPTREQLGSYLLGVLPDEPRDYIAFHLNTIECRCCAANLADLKEIQCSAEKERTRRRQKFFQSSVGRLRKR